MRPADKDFHRTKGAIKGAIDKAGFEADVEEKPKQFQKAIDSQWPASYIVGLGDVDKDGILTLASVAKPVDFNTIVFENGWVFRFGKWFRDEHLAEYVSDRQDKADVQDAKAKDKEQDAIQDWSDISQFKYDDVEIAGEYIFDVTGFHGSASQVVAHALGYHRAVQEILQTQEDGRV